MLKRVLARAGIPKVRFHDLRHTFATIALQTGVDIKTVSGMLGHFSAGFTLDTYAHVTTSAQKEAAETLGQILKCNIVTNKILVDSNRDFLFTFSVRNAFLSHYFIKKLTSSPHFPATQGLFCVARKTTLCISLHLIDSIFAVLYI